MKRFVLFVLLGMFLGTAAAATIIANGDFQTKQATLPTATGGVTQYVIVRATPGSPTEVSLKSAGVKTCLVMSTAHIAAMPGQFTDVADYLTKNAFTLTAQEQGLCVDLVTAPTGPTVWSVGANNTLGNVLGQIAAGQACGTLAFAANGVNWYNVSAPSAADATVTLTGVTKDCVSQ